MGMLDCVHTVSSAKNGNEIENDNFTLEESQNEIYEVFFSLRLSSFLPIALS